MAYEHAGNHHKDFGLTALRCRGTSLELNSSPIFHSLIIQAGTARLRLRLSLGRKHTQRGFIWLQYSWRGRFNRLIIGATR